MNAIRVHVYAARVRKKSKPSLESKSLLHSMRPLPMQNGVNVLIPLQLEVLAQLILNSRLDSREDILEDAKASRILLIVALTLIDAGADETGVPAIHVAADDVGGRVVADHVDVAGQALVAVDGVHPRGHDVVGVQVGRTLGLAVHDALELDACESFVHGFQADAERALRHARDRVLRWAEHVALREVDGDAVGDGVLGDGLELSVFAAQQVHDDLHVGCVVARVAEDQDGVDVHLVEGARARGLALFFREDAVGCDGRVPGDDVVRHDHVLEAVLLRHLAAFVALATHD